MRRSRVPPFDHLVGIEELLGQTHFPKAFNKELGVCMPAPSDQLGNCKRGIELKHTSRCLTGLSVTSEMGKSGRETAIRWRKG
jgi:hypothetical protein